MQNGPIRVQRRVRCKAAADRPGGEEEVGCMATERQEQILKLEQQLQHQQRMQMTENTEHQSTAGVAPCPGD